MNHATGNRRWKRVAALAVTLVCGAAFASASLVAQITFAAAQSSVPISGAVQPIETVDPAGNLYLVQSDSELVRLGADGTQSAISIANVNFYNVQNLACDSAGTVYVFGTDASYKPTLLEISASGTQTILPAPFDNFAGVDGKGNLYFYNPPISSAIYEYSQSGSLIAAINTRFYPSDISAVGVDQAGNLYLNASGGYWIASANNNYAPTNVPTGSTEVAFEFNFVNNFMVSDAQGTVYFIWKNFVFGPVLPGSWAPAPIAVAANNLSQIVADAKGDLFVQAVDGTIMRVQPNNADFGKVNLCSQPIAPGCGQTLTLNYAAGYDSGGGVFGQTFTQGVVSQDFTISGGLNTVSPFPGVNAGVLLQTTASFTPQGVGSRMGAVQLVDASGNVYSTAYLHGNGTAPQIAYGPGAQTTVLGGLNAASGLVIDPSGNLFIADTSNDRLLKVTPAGVQTMVASGLGGPFNLAMDGVGNLFTIDSRDNTLLEVSQSGTQTTVLSNLGTLVGMTMDGAGNLFLLDATNDRVVEQTPNGVQTTVATGIVHPTALAVDDTGNLYVGDNLDQVVWKITPANQRSVVASNIGNPKALALDAAGDLWIADQSDNTVIELSAAGQQTVIGTGLIYPNGVTLDSTGNVFIADDSGNRIVEVNRSQAPTVSFASTTLGSTSSDSPQSVQILNVGNASLNLTNLSAAPNFGQVDGPGTPEDCTAALSLSPGAGCNLSLSFTPEAVGSISGSVVLTDNALNVNPATQTIRLSGTGTQDTQTISFNTIAAQTVGASVMLSASASSGLPVSFSSATPTVCSVSGGTAKMLASGTCSILASQAGNAVYNPAPSVTQSIVVTSATTSSFTITPLPGTETISRGVLGGFLLELKSVNGFSGNVTLGCSGGPAGSQCADLPQTVKLNGTALAISGILFPKTTKAGTYTLTFAGISGSLKSSATATFIVK